MPLTHTTYRRLSVLGGRRMPQFPKYGIKHSSHWHMNSLPDTIYIGFDTPCVAQRCTRPLHAAILTHSVPAVCNQMVQHILFGMMSSEMIH